MKKIILISIMFSMLLGSAFADNIIELKKADLGWSIEDEELFVSLTAETMGWVAVGLGSARMDGAVIFIGYFKDGEAYFEEHLGRGHSHRKTEVQRPVSYEVTEENGVTKISFSVAKSDFIKTGQTELPVIVAWGSRDSFTSLHRYRDSTVISF